jgi:ABC-type glycerol-3-phosphate transport system permease component
MADVSSAAASRAIATGTRVRRAQPIGSHPLRALGYAAMAIAVILVGIPIYWMLLATFKTNQEIFTAPPRQPAETVFKDVADTLNNEKHSVLRSLKDLGES